MARDRRYCVFRTVNEARKEIFLVATPHSVFQAISDIARNRPPAIRDWDFSDISRFESLEFDLDKETALAFVKARVEAGSRRGYRYILYVHE